MSGKNRQPYLTATVLNQDFLDECFDNLETRIEMVVDIESPTGIIRASDRNKYVGSTFYEALLVFPVIGRTVGEWLSSELQFSNLTLELSNADGRFNDILPGGANYNSWVGRSVTVMIGIADKASTYSTIFRGAITDQGGMRRSVKSVTLVARDDFDRINANFPNTSITRASYPKLQQSLIGKLLPVIYGDFTVSLEPSPAIVPAYVTNGNDPQTDHEPRKFEVSIGSPAVFTSQDHGLDVNDKIQFATTGSLPTGISTGVDYYVIAVSLDQFQVSTTMGGGSVSTSGTQSGEHTFFPGSGVGRNNVSCVISVNNLSLFDNTSVYLKRGDTYYRAPSSEVTNIGAGNKTFEIIQNTGSLWAASAAYLYDAADTFWVLVKGKDLGAYDDNPVAQAKDLLKTYGGLVDVDFHANWATYRDKSTPAQSAIVNFKSRIWEDQPKPVLTYALSILEQIRLEAFVDRSLLLKINSLHYEDFDVSPSFMVRNWDVVKDSFQPKIDEKNNFNRLQGAFDYHPDKNENAFLTDIYRNDTSITQIGRTISKRITFPNLYDQAQVELQVQEILRMASAFFETVDCTLTWRAMLQDIGDFVELNVQIEAAQFENVPAMIREVGYNPRGLAVPVKLWSMALLPFPGYVPGYAGTTGGYNASLTKE